METETPEPLDPLDTVSTDDLIQALKKRAKTMFLIHRPHDQRGETWDHSVTGKLTDVLGLVERGKHYAIIGYEKLEKEESDGDA